ncbi:HNH endonuclease, partial [Salmonella enterica subsp. enterica]|nr:HNH endonuclease [Salmonella enterica subsp. enterica]
MVKVININGNLVELPEPSAKLSKAESPDGR